MSDKVPMSDKEYVMAAGNTCPFCHSQNNSSNVEGYEEDRFLTPTRLAVTTSCNSCGMVWKEIYYLKEYTSVDEFGRECLTPGKPGQYTKKQFKKKPSGKNSRCLKGLICPDCGNEQKLLVEVKYMVGLEDVGEDHDDQEAIDCTSLIKEDYIHDDETPTICPKCKLTGKLKDFRYVERE